MTLSFPKSTAVLVRDREFRDLLQALIATIDNHLKYVDDSITQDQLYDLECNGIRKHDTLTVTTVAHMLSVVNKDDMFVGPVVQELFKTIPILSHYWMITKLNKKSVYIKRLTNVNLAKTLEKLHAPPATKLKQTTLTHFDAGVATTSNGFPPVDSSVSSDRSSTTHAVNPVTVTGHDNESAASITKPSPTPSSSSKDGFQLATNTIPMTLLSPEESSPVPTANSFSAFAAETPVEDDADVPSDPVADPMRLGQSPCTDKSDDLSYSNSSMPAISSNNKNVMDLDARIYSSLQQLLSQTDKAHSIPIDVLADWVDDKFSGFADNRIRDTLTVQVLQQNITDFETKLSRYANDKFHSLQQKLYATSSEAQIDTMQVLNQDAKRVILDNQRQLDDIKHEVHHFKEIMKNDIENHKEKLKIVQSEWIAQCKSSMQEHLDHRRIVFTNQKAQFDIDMKNARDDMDSYLAKMYATKETMQSEMSIMQQKINGLNHPLRDTMPVSDASHKPQSLFSPSHVPSPTANPVPPDDVPSIPVTSALPKTPWSTNKNLHDSKNKPFSKNTTVQVDTGFICIPYAIVDSHRLDENGELVYDIHTQDNCRFTFASTLVHALPPERPSPPPKSSTHHQKYKHTSFPSRPHAPMDENSMSSPFQQTDDSEVEFVHSSRALMPNQYRIKGQPRERTIMGTNMLRHADNWNLSWKNCNDDPKDFYESLRGRIEDYGIPLKSYMDLTRDSSLLTITRDICQNYDNASKEMSRHLYILINTYKKEWFDTNPKLDLLLHYGEHNDGLGFLQAILKDSHPNLRKLHKSATIDKPRIHNYETWFSYMKQYRKWVDFEGKAKIPRQYSPEEHVSNILLEIKDEPSFKVAKEKLDEQMAKVNENLILFPEDLLLHNIGMTIYDLMPADAKTTLPTYNPNSSYTINKVNTRLLDNSSKYRGKIQSPSSTSKDKPVYRGWEDVQCPACKTWGHHIDHHGCDHTAINQNIMDYRRAHKKDFDKSSVLDHFKKHQDIIRSRKLSSKKKRNLLRQKLRAAKLDLRHDPQQYDEIKSFYIKSFKKEYREDDLLDPRADNTLDVHEYDILDSEDEVETDSEN